MERKESEMKAVLRAALGTPEPGGDLGRSALIPYIPQARVLHRKETFSGQAAGDHGIHGIHGIHGGKLLMLRSPAATAQLGELSNTYR